MVKEWKGYLTLPDDVERNKPRTQQGIIKEKYVTIVKLKEL